MGTHLEKEIPSTKVVLFLLKLTCFCPLLFPIAFGKLNDKCTFVCGCEELTMKGIHIIFSNAGFARCVKR